MKILSLILLSVIITGCNKADIKETVYEKNDVVDFIVKSGENPTVEQVFIGGTKKMKLEDSTIQVRVGRYNVEVRDDGMILGGWQTLGDTKSMIDYEDRKAIINLKLKDRWKFINHNMNIDLVAKEANIHKYYKNKISSMKTDINIDDRVELLGNMDSNSAQRLIKIISNDSLDEICEERIIGMNSRVNWFDKVKVLSIIGKKYNSIQKYKQFDITTAQKEYSDAVAEYYAILKNEYSGVEYEVEKICTPRNSTVVKGTTIVSYGISHRNPEKSIYLKDVSEVMWNADITIDSMDMDGHVLNTIQTLEDEGIEMSIGNQILNIKNINNNVIKLKEIMYYFDGVARLIELESVLLPMQSYVLDMQELDKGEVFRIERWDGQKEIKSGMKINFEVGSNTKVSKFNLDVPISLVWSEFFN